MPFELQNTPKDIAENLHWLYVQKYRTAENQATEALFKWFFFSQPSVQKRFLSLVCERKGRRASWQGLNLQLPGRQGTPDAVLRFADNSRLLFEVKTKQNSVSRKQLIRHLRSAGLKKSAKSKARDPKVLLLTPDFKEPAKLKQLSEIDRSGVLWVPWIQVIAFLSKKLKRGLKSRDRLLRDGLLVYLTKDSNVAAYLPTVS